MARSKQRNNYLKYRAKSNRKACFKQRNICVNILRKTRKQCHSNPEVSRAAENKKFWKTVKNFLSHKSSNFEKIVMVENDMVISEDQKIADIFIECSDTNCSTKIRLTTPKDIISAKNNIENFVL